MSIPIPTKTTTTANIYNSENGGNLAMILQFTAVFNQDTLPRKGRLNVF
jgi:hypothetical protein